LVSAEGPAGVCRPHGPPQKTPRLRQRPRGFENLLTGSVGGLCRGALSSGAFWHYLSGYAAVATAGEEIAAAHADGRPQRDSLGHQRGTGIHLLFKAVTQATINTSIPLLRATHAAGWGLSEFCPLPGGATKKGMIHLPDHAFCNFEGKRSLPLPVLFGLFLGGHDNR
jgi:hypothetical protein